MSAFCVFGMTESLAKTLAARKAPPQERAGANDSRGSAAMVRRSCCKDF